MKRKVGVARDDAVEETGASLSRAERSAIFHRLLKLHLRLLSPFSTHLEKRHKISVNEFRLLMMIGHRGVTASHELAEETGLNTMRVSRSVAALAAHGRIEVAIDPNNRRRKILRLTEEGRKLYEQMMPTTDKVIQYLFESLRLDEILAFDRYVTTLIAGLEARDPGGHSLFLERTRPEED